MILLTYLLACAAAGVLVGRAAGAFARASFHYPYRVADLPAVAQATLRMLDVLETPAFYVLTLAASLLVARLLLKRARPVAWRARLGWLGILWLTAALVAVPATNAPGRLLTAATTGVLAIFPTWLLLRMWSAAVASGGGFVRRLGAQMPVVLGHLAASATASVSLGFRGENALVHGIALIVAVAVFLSETAVAAAIAWAAHRRAYS